MNPEEKLFAEDQNVEITDLPGHERAGPAERWPRPRRTPQHLWRQHLFQLAALVLLGLFSLALLLRGAPGIGSFVLSGIFGPSSSPTALTRLNTGLFYVNKGPAWAQLTIDSQRIEHIPAEGREPPLRLSPGPHHILWRAAPFPPQACVVSVPANPMDTCAARETTIAPNGYLARVISFLASPTSLTRTERASLIATISIELARLQNSDTVYPGERFVNNSNNNGGLIDTARQALHATLSLALDINHANGGRSCTGGDTIRSCTLNGQDCHALCTREVSSSNAWEVVALVRSSWTYTTLDGRVVAAQMADALGRAALVEHFLPLDVTWDGANWHVHAAQDFLNGPIPCVAAQDNDAIGNFFGSSPWQAFGWNYMPATNSAAGCLLELTSIVYGGPSPAARPLIIYLHRFGVFIAINHLAQEYNPEMPRPTAYEISLAQEIMARAHLSISL